MKDNDRFSFAVEKRTDGQKKPYDASTFRRRRGVIKVVSDVMIVLIQTILFGVTVFVVYNKIFPAPLYTGGYLIVALYLVWISFLLSVLGGYRIGIDRRSNVVLSHIIGLFMADAFSYFELSLVYRAFLPLLPMFIKFLVSIGFSVIWTLVAFYFYSKFIPPRIALYVSGSENNKELAYKMAERQDLYIIKKSIYYKNYGGDRDNLDDVKREIKNFDYIVINNLESSVRNDILKYCYENYISVYLTPRISDIMVRGAKEINQFDTPILECRNCGLTSEQKFFKRFFDIIFSLLVMIILSPLFLVISLAVHFYDNGPVFYKQARLTEGGKIFDVLKFRSMIVGAEKMGEPQKATDDDERITPVGKLLRRFRLDELPQFINVLKGDMSVVGPRPERVENYEEYTKTVPEFIYRTKVKAGLTGYAQVMGKYNTSPYDKLILDLIYIQQYSFFGDIKIIFLTIKVIFRKESTEGFASNESDAENEVKTKTEDEFKGSEIVGYDENGYDFKDFE